MSETKLFEHGYAVVIGVDDYTAPVRKLPAVVKDVTALNDALAHPQRCAYKKENVRLLTGSQSTRKNILDSLDWLRDKVEADSQATAVIYYSGHGHVVDSTGKYYLIPYDYLGEGLFDESAIKAEIFSARVDAIKAQAPRTLILLDCCHAAGIEGGKNIGPPPAEEVSPEETGMGDEALVGGNAAFPIDMMDMEDAADHAGEPGDKSLDDHRNEEGRAVLNSSTAEQKSYVRKDGAMSHFTYHLIQGLTGHATNPNDDEVLVTDVMSWVWRKVTPAVKEEWLKEQTPVMRTVGVFPVAMLIGGEGVAKGLDGMLPDPLAPLPEPSVSIKVDHAEAAIVSGGVDTGGGDFAGRDIDKSATVFDQREQKVGGNQINIDKMDGDIGQISDIIQGDKVLGDKVNKATRSQSGRDTNLDAIFAPLATLVAGKVPVLPGKVENLKAQVALGASADDNIVASLVQDIADTDPESKLTLVALFTRPEISAAAGPTTTFVLGRLG